MTGFIFLLEVVAMVLVCWWAYRADGAGPEKTGDGFFGMTGDFHRELGEAIKRRPVWKHAYKVRAVTAEPNKNLLIGRPDENKKPVAQPRYKKIKLRR